jgi:nicotinate dehydrogenase subunit B
MSLRRARTPIAWLGLLVVGCGGGGHAADAGASEASISADQGRFAVVVRHCGDCHQSSDPADGVLSGQTTPVPGPPSYGSSYGSNLTPDPDTGMDGWDAGAIATAILAGVDEQGRTLCPSMPRWADAGMPQDEALSIAAYLQSLTPVWHLVPASVCGSANQPADAGP